MVALKKAARLQPVYIGSTGTILYAPFKIQPAEAKFMRVHQGDLDFYLPTFNDLESFASHVGRRSGNLAEALVKAGLVPMGFRDNFTLDHLTELAEARKAAGAEIYFVSDLRLYLLGDPQLSKQGKASVFAHVGGEALTAYCFSSAKDLLVVLESDFFEEPTEQIFPVPVEVKLLSLPPSSRTGGEAGEIRIGNNVAGATYVGERKVNQDGILIHYDPDTGRHFLILGDGIAGNVAGELASRLAIQAAYTKLSGGSSIERAFAFADGVITEKSVADFHGSTLGTTLDAVVIDGNRIELGHSGDSRVYIVTPEGRVRLLTRDHILLPQVSPFIFPLEGSSLEDFCRMIEALPVRYKGILIGAVDGRGNQLAVDTWGGELQKGDWVLLTSDGLIKAFGDIKFHAFLSSLRASGVPFQEAVGKIMEASRANWYDNVAVIFFEA